MWRRGAPCAGHRGGPLVALGHCGMGSLSSGFRTVDPVKVPGSLQGVGQSGGPGMQTARYGRRVLRGRERGAGASARARRARPGRDRRQRCGARRAGRRQVGPPDEALTAVGGMRVLRTQGLEVEAPLAFAALHRLLRPVLDCRRASTEPQARALAVAFGEEEGLGRAVPGGGGDPVDVDRGGRGATRAVRRRRRPLAGLRHGGRIAVLRPTARTRTAVADGVRGPRRRTAGRFDRQGLPEMTADRLRTRTRRAPCSTSASA